jgi:anion-transporting  ArsA/GET3 family ATPase
MRILDDLGSRDLIVVTGKGGVGKSAVAATLGTMMADAGRRTLVLEVDPRENVHQMLGAPPSGGEILPVGRNLFLQNLQPRTVIDRLVLERVRFGVVARRIFKSPVYHHFTAGAPGLKEMAVLGHALLLVEGRIPDLEAYDTVVLDAPATGHGVSLLAAPQLVSEAIRQGPISQLSGEVAELVSSERRCGVIVVTLAEEMPVTEALDLRRLLNERVGRDPDLLIVNGLYPKVGPESGVGEPEVGEPADLADDPVESLWRERRKLNELELARLASSWPGPRVELPLLPIDRGPELIRALATVLSGSTGRPTGTAT